MLSAAWIDRLVDTILLGSGVACLYEATGDVWLSCAPLGFVLYIELAAWRRSREGTKN